MAIYLLFLLLCVDFGYQTDAERDPPLPHEEPAVPHAIRRAEWCPWGSWTPGFGRQGRWCVKVDRRKRQCCTKIGPDLIHWMVRPLHECYGKNINQKLRRVACSERLPPSHRSHHFSQVSWCPWGPWISYTHTLGYTCRPQAFRTRQCACLKNKRKELSNLTTHNLGHCPGLNQQSASVPVSCYDPVKTKRLIFLTVGVSLITLTALSILIRIHYGARIARWYHHSGPTVYPSQLRPSAPLVPIDDGIAAPPSYDEVIMEVEPPSYNEALAQQLGRGRNNGLTVTVDSAEEQSPGGDNETFNAI